MEKVGSLSPYRLEKLWRSAKPDVIEAETWKRLRKELPADLFRFCKFCDVAVTEKCHRPMCDFFPKLDASIPLDRVEWGDRLLLYPRATFKSTVANIFCLAVVLTYPSAKIAIQSSTIDIASAFVDEIKNYMLAPEDSKGRMKLLTPLQTIWPDHVLPERNRGASGTWTTPARKRYSKEGSIDALSIEESKASAHYDLGRNDDVASEINSGTGSSSEGRAVVGKKLLEARNLFANTITLGTPQADDDAYSLLRENLGDDLLVLTAAAWTVKAEAANKPEALLEENDVDLLFPRDANGAARLTFKKLQSYRRANPESFKRQQLCMTNLETPKQIITQEMIDKHLLPTFHSFNASPAIAAWDLSYVTGRNNTDFSVGSAGVLDEVFGVVVQNIRRGKFSKHELITTMVHQAILYRVQTIWLENTNGVQFIEEDLRKALNSAGLLTTAVKFIDLSYVSGAKELRYKSLYDALVADELHFSVDVTQADILRELTKPKGGRKFDDVADSISHLLAKLKVPMNRYEPQKASPADLILVQNQLRNQLYGYRDPERVYKETPEPTPAWGSYTEHLITEKPTHSEDGIPIYDNEQDYLYNQH